MSRNRILVVDDDPSTRDLLRVMLERAGHEVREAGGGRAGLRDLYAMAPDLVILDVNMPDLDGWATLERIRDLSEVPVLMLTARQAEMERVRGLQGGADDYVVKPFGHQEIVARVQALLRRTDARVGEQHTYADPSDQSYSEGVWIRRLLDVGRALMTERDVTVLLERVLLTARQLTGARYAALGILGDRRSELDRFLTSGIDGEEARRTIGDLPRGRGVLGALIQQPHPLRLTDIGQHPSSCGFPARHPAMRSFLGVPIVIRGQAWGNLYLTEKEGGEFTEVDEEGVTILADWAAIAIDNANTYETGERRRKELEKAFRGLEATRDVAVAIGCEIGLEHVLELIVKRGRALVGARGLVIMLREGDELAVHAGAGHVDELRGVRLPIAGSTSGQVLERRCAERITDLAARRRIVPGEFGVADAQTALLVPMVHRGEALGVLAAFDRGQDGSVFAEDDEQLLRTFAASAATAVALAQSVQSDRLRISLAAADAERRRWARELHDETLQSLAGLRVLLSAALRGEDLGRAHTAMRQAVDQIELEIANLRAIIAELRPAALDELGLRTAIEVLLERHREDSGSQVEAELRLPGPSEDKERLDRDLETAVYRLVQEALTNVAKHAHAERVRVAVSESDGELLLEIQDDGVGFDSLASSEGFGLAGMRERAGLAGGALSVESGEQGTLVSACLPVRRDRGGVLASATVSQRAVS
jgi:signal transduction histidine kinase/DNA-binding response OmpR family regulator